MGEGKTRVRQAACLVAATLFCTSLAAPPVRAAEGLETFVTMLSDAGDYIGGGQSRFFHPGNGSVAVAGSRSYLTVSVAGGNLGDSYHMDFAAPPGRVLVEGVFERAQRAPFREAGRPGIDIGGDGRGCNTIEGRFEVKRLRSDTDGTITSLWIVYEQHCEGGLAALFGEVRYRVPGDGGQAMVNPRHLRWPDADKGGATTVAPVVVVNSSRSAVTIGTPSIGGTEAASFEIRVDECAGEALAPNSACLIFLRFNATQGGQNSARLSIPEVGGVTHEVALRGWVLTGRTRFTMNSDEGDYIGGGAQLEYTPANAAIAVGGGYRHVAAWIEGEDGNWWSADFAAPQGDILAPGTTYNATRYPFNGPGAGMDVSGSGRGCNELTGTFTVDVIEISDAGELEEVGITYEQHCEGATPALRGVLEYRVGGEPRPLAPDPSRPARGTAYQRGISLNERRSKLVGRVTAGVKGCFANVPVVIQRRRDGEFQKVARVVTNDDGRFAKRIDMSRGLFRAVAPRKDGPKGGFCVRAVSRSLWF
ncbi:MAG: hypothetical protein M3161_00475 [Actinomycetota bacterium]|nr:hypothetical protein [Actinomycetota bacterium]